MPITKIEPLRDPDYLKWVRTQPCIITGHRGRDVDPCHIGTLGRGIKSSDDEALPMRHELHRRAHDQGEMSFFRKHLPTYVLREALKAYAREQHREYMRKKGDL